MRLKFVVPVVITLFAGSAYAQDKIHKRDGEVIDAKVKNVGTKTITYSRFDNQSGPEYTILKHDVLKIKYEGGSEEAFESMGRHRGPSRMWDASDGNGMAKVNYGRNLIALAPLQFTDNGLGFSLSYNRALDKDAIISFYLPVIATFKLNSGSYLNTATNTYVNGHQDMMFYVMPGVLLYPGGSLGKVRYGIGPSLVYASGERSSVLTDVWGYTYEKISSHTMLGIVLNNSLNINPSEHIYLGLEFGFGFTYLNRIDGINNDTRGLVQGGFKLGYRF
ncbi:MAG: hypothetical protein K0Q79_1133 [Flavipsychrobacter sp.]|jgi:hypothetical protein|nr:hypothetical protein [Flavipsychrobacter sp.]